MALFRKRVKGIKVPVDSSRVQRDVPNDLLVSCPQCKRANIKDQVKEDYICKHCDYHLYFPSRARIKWLVDEGSFEESEADLTSTDPLDFPDYQKKLDRSKAKSGLQESIITGTASIGKVKTAIGVMDKEFIMASMGAATGEKIVRLFEQASRLNLPVVLYIASGGARMQEGILSLMQMAKVSQAVANHRNKGLFYLAVLTHPTTGGVTASFAMQADIILAEPQATIGFAGKRVIEQTLRRELDQEFQSAERTLRNGFIDHIVDRTQQRKVICSLLKIHHQAKSEEAS